MKKTFCLLGLSAVVSFLLTSCAVTEPTSTETTTTTTERTTTAPPPSMSTGPTRY
ncbi:MAG TPA: hypothetical protein VH188_01050 [Chthoniobacterales bacterium]|nr:hypothetical protein [Chthoniobacterales bacterium]